MQLDFNNKLNHNFTIEDIQHCYQESSETGLTFNQTNPDSYQLFLLFRLFFFFGFGRHIAFFGVGGALAAAFLSFQVCLQDKNKQVSTETKKIENISR